MPQSSHRHKHKHSAHGNIRHEQAALKPHRKRNAALLMAIFIGFLGLAIGALASGMNYSWMIASTAIGAVAGALIGHGIDKSLDKKV
jgi:outer membrane lipoprotein SlyB